MHPLTMSSYTKRLRGTYSPRKKEARFSTAFENDTKSLHLRNFARREASCVYLQIKCSNYYQVPFWSSQSRNLLLAQF